MTPEQRQILDQVRRAFRRPAAAPMPAVAPVAPAQPDPGQADAVPQVAEDATSPASTCERPPYVFATRPRCPACGSARLRAYKTLPDAGDGSLTRRSRCQECGVRLLVVLE